MLIPDFERTAIAVAAKLGIVSEALVVLAEWMSTVVHLRPSPIVASHAQRQGSLQIGWQQVGEAEAAWLLTTLDRAELVERAGALSREKLVQLDEMLRLAQLDPERWAQRRATSEATKRVVPYRYGRVHVSMRTRPFSVSRLQRTPERRADPTLISSIATNPSLAASSTGSRQRPRVGRELDRRRAGIAAAARIPPPSSPTEPTLNATFERDLDQLEPVTDRPATLRRRLRQS